MPLKVYRYVLTYTMYVLVLVRWGQGKEGVVHFFSGSEVVIYNVHVPWVQGKLAVLIYGFRLRYM